MVPYHDVFVMVIHLGEDGTGSVSRCINLEEEGFGRVRLLQAGV